MSGLVRHTPGSLKQALTLPGTEFKAPRHYEPGQPVIVVWCPTWPRWFVMPGGRNYLGFWLAADQVSQYVISNERKRQETHDNGQT